MLRQMCSTRPSRCPIFSAAQLAAPGAGVRGQPDQQLGLLGLEQPRRRRTASGFGHLLSRRPQKAVHIIEGER
jgi:hypothetical protein